MFRHDEETNTILRSELGRQALAVLAESEFPLTTSEIAERMGRDGINSLSRALRRLRDQGIVDVINPDQPRDRRYRLTETGAEAYEDADRFRQQQEEYSSTGPDEDV